MIRQGFARIDTDAQNSLLEAASLIITLQRPEGLVLVCPEEIAFRQVWTDAEKVMALSHPLSRTMYGQHLIKILQG